MRSTKCEHNPERNAGGLLSNDNYNFFTFYSVSDIVAVYDTVTSLFDGGKVLKVETFKIKLFGGALSNPA